MTKVNMFKFIMDCHIFPFPRRCMLQKIHVDNSTSNGRVTLSSLEILKSSFEGLFAATAFATFKTVRC